MSPFASREVIIPVNGVMSACSLGDDDLGEADVESNIVALRGGVDGDGKEAPD